MLYYPTIFGLQAAFRGRPLDLGGASKSQAPINYIFWWEFSLAVFSIIGAYHVLPLALEPILAGKTFAATICQSGLDVANDTRAFWMFLFMV